MKFIRRFSLIGFLLAGVYGCATKLPALTPSHSVVMPSGTILKVVLTEALGTDKSSPGDHFSGSLAEAIVINGRVLFPRATKVRGRVYDVREPRRMNGGALLHLVLTEISEDGRRIAITTNHLVTRGDEGVAGTEGHDIHLAASSHVDFVLASPVEM
jgi:hypothetical protein